MQTEEVIVVSGLPRSGTSLMMNMLEAGGIKLVVDGERTADEDNPKGYFELEAVKKLEDDASWVNEAKGQAVKVISKLLEALPKDHKYCVLFMRRDLREILASQKKMLERQRGETDGFDDEEMKSMYFEHLEQIGEWLEAQPNFRVLYVSYNRIMDDAPRQIERVGKFLTVDWDQDKAKAKVDQRLYRNR